MVPPTLFLLPGPSITPAAELAGPLAPILEQHCVKCHGKGTVVEGGVNFLSGDLRGDTDFISGVIDMVDLKVMPPEDQPPLPAEDRKLLLTTLRDTLKTATLSAAPARTPVRRMNRFQYSNAVEDLFQLDAEVFALPERIVREYGDYFQPASGIMPDNITVGSRPLGKSQLIGKRLAGVAPFPQDLRAEHGFDNRGDHLSLSPLLMESFLKLGRSIVDSEDFHEGTCGIWDDFFAPPASDGDLSLAIRQRLDRFLTRAFRRPVGDEAVDRYSQHVENRIAAGDTFTGAMKEAASAALASPWFLYLYEAATTSAAPERLDDFELASRLSFFLWGSIPDRELLDLAARRELSHPPVLGRQLDRLLNDRRAKRFCDSFPTQWLQLERIISAVPDPERYPDFYFDKFRISMHMVLEPLLLFETVYVENRPILQLIDSDFTYRSELLQSWYETGTQPQRVPSTTIPFTRVSLDERREGGVITNAAVMTMTSSPVRTKPVTRGAWVATVIFNDPPEPPPANVPPLPEDDESAAENLSLRQRLTLHRQRADCASCHVRIDPFGLALENYGPTGRWRDRDANGLPIDASGTLFKKDDFQNVVDFKDAILADEERFVRGFVEHLLSFALGRALTPADAAAVDQIVHETADDDFRLRAMIKQVALSDPFLHKFNPKEVSDHAD